MDITRIKQLAGQQLSEAESNIMLDEMAIISTDATIDQVAAMLDAAKRGLGFANKLRNPADKKKHVRAVFINLNKIRAALSRYLDLDFDARQSLDFSKGM